MCVSHIIVAIQSNISARVFFYNISLIILSYFVESTYATDRKFAIEKVCWVFDGESWMLNGLFHSLICTQIHGT